MSRPFKYVIWGLAGLTLMVCTGLTFPAEILFFLGVGWAFFLASVGPTITPDWGGVTLGAVCLVVLADLTHLFLGWLSRQVRGEGGPGWKWKWTASLLAVVILMFASGISSTGIAHQVGWLLTAKEPLISSQGSAVYRSLSINNLKQVGLAIHNYHSVEQTMPSPATLDTEGRLLHGWQARLLPYLEQQELYNQVNFTIPWDDPRNESPFRTRISTYLNPRFRDDPTVPGPAPSHYAGNVLVLGGDSARKLDEITDGTSNTILAGEAGAEFKPWGHPANWRDPGKGINRSPDGFGGPFAGGANFLMVDGSVRFLKNTINPKVFRALATPAGGEAISSDDY